MALLDLFWTAMGAFAHAAALARAEGIAPAELTSAATSIVASIGHIRSAGAGHGLVRQPIGYWSGEAYRRIAAAIRESLAANALTRPQWWILNHLDGGPRSRDVLVETPTGYSDRETHASLRADVSDEEYATTIDVLRRIVGNLGGDAGLP
ncbi:hypothetical protein SAMN05216377_111163 [Pseudonocardia oroxyli]|uniref:NADPH-dependent reductive aminase-like C-terminal domain-containing protein n=2 Tax=Pseudonocardia oroxyli TaxID=366584 RepID=A0A1G7TWM9_PSEOR|nr:hypothetical protein [Pseudonocardia oroxyli]SDG39735.1 hypothetical protein SAMN05216377_111163 [Pseudonocardia oroxyli]